MTSSFSSALPKPETLPTTRAHMAVMQSGLGVCFTALFAYLYHAMGSSWSGASLLPICLWLGLTPALLRRGVSLLWLANVAFFLSWSAFGVVAYRTGGFTSPALVWTFLLPLTCYTTCGRTSATFWAIMSAVQIIAFAALDVVGHRAPQDLSERALLALRLAGYVGVVVTTIVVLIVMHKARDQAVQALRRAERALERQRVLADMHDGAGSQLLWLLLSVRRGVLNRASLLTGLESALADVRLMADVADEELTCDQVLGQLRTRLEPACESSGVTLDWQTAGALDIALDSRKVLHLCRTVQEAVTNALRHASTPRVHVQISPEAASGIQISVRDFGVGFDLNTAARGRGLHHMHNRARALGGELTIERAEPGTLINLRFPIG